MRSSIQKTKHLITFLLALSISCNVFAEKVLTFSWSINTGPLNPHQTSPNQMYAQNMVYEALLKYNEDGSISPWLAKSWEITDQGKRYTFTLRDDVTFSNGEAFNAATVKANFDTVLANIEKHRWLELINQMQSVVVKSEFVVEINFKEAYYPVLQELALVRPVRFLAPSQIPSEGHTGQGIKAPIGTGPWKLASSKLGVSEEFVRNERYWGAKPEFDRVVIKVIPDPNSRAIAFETGLIDLIHGSEGQISPDTFARFKANPNYVTQVSKPFATRTLAIHSGREITNDIAVRKAFNHALNKELLATYIFHGTEPVAHTLFAPNAPYANIKLAPFKYDQALANSLLEQAGWHYQDGQKIRSKAGKQLRVNMVFNGQDASHKAIAEVVQADFKKVGIDVSLEGEERTKFFKRQKAGDFDIIINNTWGAPYDPHAFMSGMRRPAHADYEAQSGLPMKAEIDKKISQVLVTTDAKKRQQLYTEIMTTLHQQAVYLPLTYRASVSVAGPKVTNVNMGATGYEIPFEQMKPVQ